MTARRLAVALFLCAAFAIRTEAAGAPDESRRLRSAVLNEEREFRVHLPASYRWAAERRYPVLYVLDGETHLGHVSATADFLAAEGQIPETIVVAVTSTVRVRDFTQTDWPKAWIGGGGADKFRKFLEAELIPAVERSFRCDGFRTLWGHSAGGQFVLHVLSSPPSPFRAFVALSPSLDWDDRLPARELRKTLEAVPKLEAVLYVARSDDSGQALADWNGLVAALSSREVPGFHWKSEAFPDERHRTIPLVGGIHALRAIWQGYALPEALEGAKVDEVERHYAEVSRRLGWTVPVPEAALNSVAYAALERGETAGAITLFRRNADANPSSPNAWDSLADGYEKAGRLREASEAADRGAGLAAKQGDPNLGAYRRHAAKLKERLAAPAAAPK